MKILLIAVLSLVLSPAVFAEGDSVHEFTMTDIDGKDVNLSDYKGKVLVIVNTASKCGFTKQYADLVKLQADYADKGVVVIGFPANNFRNQEPGSNAEIQEFCSSKYGVDFPMFAKVSVKGEDQVPLFKYLTSAENPDFTGDIKWNFEKFVIDGEGVLRHRYRSMTNPSAKSFRKDLDELTGQSPSNQN